jgi:hypothetical protein
VRTVEMVVMMVVGLAFAALNIKYWHYIVTRHDHRMREGVERRYGVTIVRGYRGHWKVTSGPGSKLTHLRIELLQIVYFLRAFAIWAVALGGVIGVMALLQRLLSGAG